MKAKVELLINDEVVKGKVLTVDGGTITMSGFANIVLKKNDVIKIKVTSTDGSSVKILSNSTVGITQLREN